MRKLRFTRSTNISPVLRPSLGFANQNPLADVAGNTGNTAAGLGLTSGFAISGGLYQSPLSSGKPLRIHIHHLRGQ